MATPPTTDDTPEAPAGFAFEHSLAELEKTVRALESGDLSLEQALKAFEKGIGLTRECQQALQDAEQKVRILLERNGQTSLQNFDATEND